MKTSRLALLLLCLLTCLCPADSGGPYEFVPDLKADERPPIRRMPEFSAKLPHYLEHEPELIWEKGAAEPTGFRWKRLEQTFATIQSADDWGRMVYAVRYVPRANLENGSIACQGILILARTEKEAYQPVYFTTGGVIDDHSIKPVRMIGSRSVLTVTTHYSGQGRITGDIHLTRGEKGWHRCEIMGSDDEVWKELDKLGYEPWHRGHWFDEDKKAGFHHVVRKDSSNLQVDEEAHRDVRIDYEVRDDKFEVKGWKFIEEKDAAKEP
jgi:hypothetical protein